MLLYAAGCEGQSQSSTAYIKEAESLDDIEEYSGSPYIRVNGNVPFFTEEELTGESYESYGDLDSLGRCSACIASIGQDMMPTEERESIGAVKPTGWNLVKYPDVVDGNYLYNRCHLIGYQLTGENANEKNLITGTRYMNVDGMLPFENMVADYVKETNNHVLYRVTPIFQGDNLLASGVLMEGESVEDKGEGILFCVYCYNVQPGVAIDYADGSSHLEETQDDSAHGLDKAVAGVGSRMGKESEDSEQPAAKGSYVVNGNNGKIHIKGKCSATGSDSNAMEHPVPFDMYEEAEQYSIQIAPDLEKRRCGNCW